jgi:methylated-DNA-[protein]-cysteine S-methyltransferase
MTTTTTQTMLYETFDSPIGELLVVGDGEALSGLYMQDGRRPVTVPSSWERDSRPFGELREQLGEYFAGDRRGFDLPLAPQGSEFQLRVWEGLREIPYGETESYGELAARIGHPGSARAVGAANGRNPISIVVPCHRVIGAGGSLTGYAGGLERKRLLLDFESQRFGGPDALSRASRRSRPGA